ncbi:MAG: hypothetical protein OHK0022_07290 [Roseiflexaceae bacterium]
MARKKTTATQLQATEMTFASSMSELINQINTDSNLGFGQSRVEIRDVKSVERADLIIPSVSKGQKVACVIEFKQVYENILDMGHMTQAYSYARSLEAPYFCLCNGKDLFWFDTQEVVREGGINISKGFIKNFSLSQIKSFNNISTRDELQLKEGFTSFLKLLYERVKNKKAIPLQGINEFLIIRLHRDIDVLYQHYLNLVESKSSNRKFAQGLQEWFQLQGYNFTFSVQDYEIVARQSAYLLVNKILIFTALQQRWKLSPLEIPDGLKEGGLLMNILTSYFQEILRVDYHTIFSTDNLNIGFPDHQEAIGTVRDLVKHLNKYDLANIGYDIIGYIFERLIPQDERHKLGQYFTRAEVVDLMLVFCSKSTEDKIFDPAVGAGTYLVRAYQYKKVSSWNAQHDEILKLLWGCDIVQFPAHLTSINIAVRGLDSRRNFPRVLFNDFFRLTPENIHFRLPIPPDDGESNDLFTAVDYKDEKPGAFDVIIGNPPYTRQEHLGDLVRSETYKEDLIKNALTNSDGSKLASISRRSGLYAYFFVHSYKFLKEGGRLGFITANPWLNAAYGSGLQEFLLDNFKIIAILETDVESWFPGVAVDNCIVILEKCSGLERKEERRKNIIHFVRFTRSLIPDFATPTSDDDKTHRERFDKLESLVRFIETTNQFYDRDGLRIYPKLQGELQDEGRDEESKIYIGSRWGKFNTAPPIYYKLVEDLREKFTLLSNICDVSYGLKTGANEFFYLTEDEIMRYGIEDEYWHHDNGDGLSTPNYVMKSPTESESIFIDLSNLKQRVLLFNTSRDVLEGTSALAYIELGERQTFNERATCRARDSEEQDSDEDHRSAVTCGWYDLGNPLRCKILWPELSSSSRKRRVFYSEQPIVANSKLYAIYPKDIDLLIPIVAISNSTVIDLFVEFAGQSYGGFRAPNNLSINEARKLLFPNLDTLTEEQKSRLEKAFSRYSKKPLGSIRQEYNTGDNGLVDLKNIDPDLRAIDEIVMGELLGLSEEEQLALYSAVINLAEIRFNKAKTGEIKTRAVIKGEIDSIAFTETVLANAEADIAKVNSIYRNIISGRETVAAAILSPDIKRFQGNPILENLLWGYRLRFGSESRNNPMEFSLDQRVTALYYQAWAKIRVETVMMPVQIESLGSETDDLSNAIGDLIDSVGEFTNKIVDNKVRKTLGSLVWNAIRPQLTNINNSNTTD